MCVFLVPYALLDHLVYPLWNSKEPARSVLIGGVYTFICCALLYHDETNYICISDVNQSDLNKYYVGKRPC